MDNEWRDKIVASMFLLSLKKPGGRGGEFSVSKWTRKNSSLQLFDPLRLLHAEQAFSSHKYTRFKFYVLHSGPGPVDMWRARYS